MHFHSWHNKMKYFFTRVESKLTMGFRRDTAIVAFLIGFSSKLSWILALDRVFILCQGWVGGFYSGQALMCALWCLDANWIDVFLKKMADCLFRKLRAARFDWLRVAYMLGELLFWSKSGKKSGLCPKSPKEDQNVKKVEKFFRHQYYFRILK